jgi:hypothetical protein
MRPSAAQAICVFLLFSSFPAFTQHEERTPSQELLAAASKGETASVRKLLAQHGDIEAKDKNGRTPLMLASQHGRVDTVKLLLASGARPDARDGSGLTAYGLTIIDPAGRGPHEEVLKLLPQPPRLRLLVNAGWTPGSIVSSCFESRDRLLKRIGAMHPEESLLKELQAFLSTSGKGLAQITGAGDDAAEGDGIVNLDVQPGAACETGSGDVLTFSIDVRVSRARDRKVLLEKRFGGGVKGMRQLTVNNVEQYAPVYESWMKPQAGPIYWAVVGALMRSEP